jgi:uncharacterized membrane protein
MSQPAPLIDSTERWVSLSPLPAAALLGLALAVSVSALLAAYALRREPQRSRKWILRGLRLLAGIGVLLFVAELGTRQVQVARLKTRIAVLVDRSRSMQFPVDDKKETREQFARVAVEKLFERKGDSANSDTVKGDAVKDDAVKDDGVSFELYGFGNELSALSAWPNTPASDSKTDLAGALRSLSASASDASKRLSGVVVLSDGADTQGLFAAGNESVLQSLAKSLAVPISTVAIGTSAVKDLSVDNVKMDEFAFVRNAMTAEVDLKAVGYGGQTVQVVLQREGQVVATKAVHIENDDEVKTVSFTFSPDQTGRFVYTFSTPVLPNEALSENNAKSVTLKVIRDRVRVLLVAGRPTWDERFVRGVLRNDPNVELVSFYILRTATDESSAHESEMSLIPFPREEIFERKISTFDVVVVLNFGHIEQGTSIGYYARSIDKYVRNGGALAYLGGDASFSEGRSTAFDALLPLESAGPANLEPFSPRLTTEGARHPITSLRGVTTSSDSLWSGLSAVQGINSTRAKAGATVLLEHPTHSVAGRNAPLLAVWEQSRGRALALASDATWYWALPSKSKGDASRLYERFWSQAIRWLVRDPDFTTLVVTGDEANFEPGQPIRVTAEAKRGDYQPAAGATIEVELKEAETGTVVERKIVEATADGTAKLEFAPPPKGAYKLVSKATEAGQPLGDYVDAVAVRAASKELADSSVNAAGLEALAKRSAGRFFLNEMPSASQIPFAAPPEVEVGRAKEQPLWIQWRWLVALTLVLATEWFLRRRFGYA